MQNKQEQIIGMFDAIAQKYDRANHALSLGIDISWRKEACRRAFDALQDSLNRPLTILDVACGSGDMIKHWHNAADTQGVEIAQICGFDPSANMLEVAKAKLEGYKDTHFLQGEAKALPFENESVDILSIAYGLRNVLEYKQALSEFARVLKKGGVLVVLEFLKSEKPTILGRIAGYYTRKILPLLGGVITSNFKAYQYLPNSIESFITARELEELLQERGVQKNFCKTYSAGISTLFIGVKE
ncbi:bifunctional demethylmenaquinone methyltransferase/2-methoxy-6-polyprenyl-1,4-benzoquinol methylase UbiE [Helicobacter sp. MIT 00-7814]|uniref:bifunctional demethylmenaquinone methyltransferase/2-methoxy-6-polyprenyl-1,4-benzoquinol methylase UbiE n=1 Tax=unclassified Helicobacter TaxID=2593540 RepID=UPI000E1E9CB0|nr:MULTISPECIES: bifunctional demethylmenaquinone methyltransferase/2-methoxy-6-polyprenyl-1,4-benzoquinol methylase UbiE [unclassified Helicobacter]RDU53563.1 bifunctional demethylmenaquinone methyltransferase/2-methoxy-6-polyprenyl-1,4-benzoquinol methylase UbiE [Helicobacter sp. MIT 00-7814]RDU57011.1 bifunctional demethylmenaquinone methyltransferase/2-methoxy-6-polyprenyl-1,4-benzoquinol methylase UbiE [Helicobacter sp. MIT 99-10781]